MKIPQPGSSLHHNHLSVMYILKEDSGVWSSSSEVAATRTSLVAIAGAAAVKAAAAEATSVVSVLPGRAGSGSHVHRRTLDD